MYLVPLSLVLIACIYRISNETDARVLSANFCLLQSRAQAHYSNASVCWYVICSGIWIENNRLERTSLMNENYTAHNDRQINKINRVKSVWWSEYEWNDLMSVALSIKIMLALCLYDNRNKKRWYTDLFLSLCQKTEFSRERFWLRGRKTHFFHYTINDEKIKPTKNNNYAALHCTTWQSIKVFNASTHMNT